ncbi:hypothetical protein EJ04DRAFT_581165 [Polyplosphaeria fusca]|uniref:DUF7580 domain-containing protein n=1 Tax=Polyplosphaeria fusca TaxID=682080 RepID=A0A9P4QPT1_9PLEO|nr:hypothetical protein EJ04DRAFT_581165 [Polyplosphaeria fusca]
MATGIETAGLVLGSIPLILAGLEFYAKGIAVSKRYWRYREEFKSLLIELRTEHTMCVNSINMLLIGVVRHQDMKNFLANPCGDVWKDPKFERKLKERLDKTYDSYIDTITQMNATTEKFKERLKLDPSGKPQFTDTKVFKEHCKRLKFSLNRSDYEDLMTKLRQANSSLHRMTTQTISLETLQNAKRSNRQSIPNFKVIQDRAMGFHSALRSGWKCACQTDHNVSLRLEHRMEDVSSDEDEEEEKSMRDPFRVVFCYSHHHSRRQGDPTVKPWSWEEADVRITLEKQQSAPSSTCNRDAKRGVHFQTRKAVKAALDPTPNMQPIQDLCTAIGKLQKPQRDVCLSLLATEIAKQKYGVHIYPLKDPPSEPDLWSIASLRSVLQDTKFTRQDRLRLAVTLASSVLQLHETPWLEENWGKDDIFFIKRSNETVFDHSFVSQHFNRKPNISRTKSQSCMGRIIRNYTLYALGISLIELWHNKPLHELHRPEDGPREMGNAQMDSMTEWNTAERLVDELYNEAGAKYSDAVRRCIRCQFDHRTNSLDDLAFQRDVYDGVVARLKENFDFLHPSEEE